MDTDVYSVADASTILGTTCSNPLPRNMKWNIHGSENNWFCSQATEYLGMRLFNMTKYLKVADIFVCGHK